MNMYTQWHVNVNKIVGNYLKQLRSRDMMQNTSEKVDHFGLPAVSFLSSTHSEVPENTQRLPVTFKTMPTDVTSWNRSEN